jgi:hypothetical protein
MLIPGSGEMYQLVAVVKVLMIGGLGGHTAAIAVQSAVRKLMKLCLESSPPVLRPHL